MEIDLDQRKLEEVGYKTIRQLLLARGYRPSEQTFIFFRTAQLGEQTFDVEVDFLAGEYSGTPRGHHTQKMQENSLVQEALAKIGEKFASPQYVGPIHVADFEDSPNPGEREQLQRDAFERVEALIIRLASLSKV